MKTVWTEHIKDPEEKQKFETYVSHSKELLERLSVIIERKLSSLDSSETTLEAYDKPNWQYRQAHKNGYRSCAKSILDLINPDQWKHNA